MSVKNIIFSAAGSGDVSNWISLITYSDGDLANHYGETDSSKNTYITATLSGYWYLIKLNEFGSIVWDKKITGNQSYRIKHVLDSSGNIYVAHSASTGYIVLTKFNSSGVEQWTKSVTANYPSTDIYLFRDLSYTSENNRIHIFVQYLASRVRTPWISYNTDGTNATSTTLESHRDMTNNDFTRCIMYYQSGGIRDILCYKFTSLTGPCFSNQGGARAANNINGYSVTANNGNYAQSAANKSSSRLMYAGHCTLSSIGAALVVFVQDYLGNIYDFATTTTGYVGNYYTAVCADSSGNIYVVTDGLRIFKVNTSNQVVWSNRLYKASTIIYPQSINVVGNKLFITGISYANPTYSTFNCCLPIDGTKTGSYGSFTYENVTAPTLTTNISMQYGTNLSESGPIVTYGTTTIGAVTDPTATQTIYNA